MKYQQTTEKIRRAGRGCEGPPSLTKRLGNLLKLGVQGLGDGRDTALSFRHSGCVCTPAWWL